MIDWSPEQITVIMFAAMLLLVLTGYPLAFCIGGVGMIMGLLIMGTPSLKLMYVRAHGAVTNYTLLAVPLFLFMGLMIERSGVAESLFDALNLWIGRIRGSLAMATVLTGTVLAACVGVFSASIVMLGLIALPAMLKRGYNHELACGSIIAGGCLGILIPPSIMIVLYGPMAGLSVGKLFMGAFGPGLMLSGLYLIYIAVRPYIQPGCAPPLPPEERAVPWGRKFYLLFTALIPPLLLILGVLGSIFFGIAAPTEAAGAGAFVATLIAAGYRKLSWRVVKQTCIATLKASAFIIVIVTGASIFTGIFLSAGCGNVVADLVLSAPGGKWGVFVLIHLILFMLGMFLGWLGILLIMIPIVTPIGEALGFDSTWFALMIMVNLQMAYMTPPMAPAIFFLRGVVPPDSGIDSGTIIRGVVPIVALVMVGIVVLILVPDIIMWLPNAMIKAKVT
jgi:tripartite ATP-independent transporter DctM subunit